MDRPDLVTILGRIDNVEGWLTDDQARRLHELATALGAGTRIVEIGSFRGRSTIVFGSSARPGVEVVAVDPHAGGDRGPREIRPDAARGEQDHQAFVDNLTSSGVFERVRHLRIPSASAHGAIDGDVDLLYVDGAHRFTPARDDVSRWGDRVSDGGTMLVHDAFSSVGVTMALLTTTLVDSSWRYRGRVGSLAEFRRERLRHRERWIDAGRQLLELPWFARNLAVKVLLVLRLRPLTRLLGHRSGDWPY